MLKNICTFVVISLFPAMAVATGAPVSDCACPELSCNPCESQTGVQFYSEKCERGSRMKSCAKPQCVPLDPLPATCVAKKEEPVRKIASEDAKPVLVPAHLRGPKAANLIEAKGSVWVTSPGEDKKPVNLGFTFHQNDQIETGADSMARLEFFNSKKVEEKNEVTLMERTQMRITEFTQTKASEKTVLDLLNGKIRNRVREKIKDEKSAYHVKTRTAVAGVRGTDFVISYTQDNKATSTVETLEGHVDLSDVNGKQTAAVRENETASYVVALNDSKSKVFTDDELSEYVAKGFLTPVYKMSESEIEKLKETTDPRYRVEKDRQIAAQKLICAEPAAELNQCAWECAGNPKGASSCRTDLPDVHCVRRRCNASGKWADDMRLPASFSDSCPKKGLRVGPCDY